MEQRQIKIRGIDNSNVWMPIATTFLVIFLIAIIVWFLRGGSFQLYASLFFGLYFLTRQVWVAVLLLGLVQSIIFIPLHLLSQRFSNRIEDFEGELEKTKEDQQYFIFKEKVRKGDWSIVFYILNFVINAIAFLSAGRIFLIDFYTQKLNPHYLYSFIPYPSYPLKGTVFHLPFLEITETMAWEWRNIIILWLAPIAVAMVLRLLWRFVKPWLSGNKKILQWRIGRNRIIAWIGGASGVLLILSTYFLRHIPVGFKSIMLAADLTRQNTVMNMVTAIGTFIITFHFGYQRNVKERKEAEIAGLPKEIIERVSKQHLKGTLRNAMALGIGAFFLTNQIPCAFELSVATFEVLAMVTPYFEKKMTPKRNRVENINPVT